MLRNWTLRSRLIALVVALIAVTSLLIGGLAFALVRQAITTQFESQLQATAQTVAQSNTCDPSAGAPCFLIPGTVVGAFTPTGSASSEYCPRMGSSCTPITEAKDISALGAVAAGPSGATVRTLGTYGAYRFVSATGFWRDAGSRAEFVVGFPESALDRQIVGVFAPIALIVLAVILVAAVAATLIIGRALRPLRRVANVASNVAALPLERGDVDLPQRVPDRDTNPHTEVGQVGAALNNLLDSVGSALAVRQASEAKVRAFVADASHELRTPLASIRGYAELTRRFGGELTDDVQHNIDRIESETKRMTALVEDLLLLARLDSQPELAAEDVDLSRLLVDVVSDAHAAGRDHRWDLELPDEPVIVRGDDARLHQVFTNLLANARVHTPPETRVTVQLREPAGDTVTVLVRDSGPGIPAELLPRLFGRFVRGDTSRNRTTGSTGLGLSIVSAVVQAQGGTVEVTSEPGDTTFRVTLPRAAAGAVSAPASESAPSPAPEPTPASA